MVILLNIMDSCYIWHPKYLLNRIVILLDKQSRMNSQQKDQLSHTRYKTKSIGIRKGSKTEECS
jgi:hypothetical protein